MTDTRYASRKFILAALSLLSASALVYLDKIADGVYSAVVIAVIAAYFAANVTQKAVDDKPIVYGDKP